MKGKGAASLYEVLKSASRPGGEAAAATTPVPTSDAGNPAQTLQDRLAAYKAQKLAAVASPIETAPMVSETSAVAVAEATPPPVPRIEPALPPPSAPRPVSVFAPTLVTPPAPAAEVEGPGPGERVLHLTYNSVAFAALVAVGLIFVAYAVGLRSGRRGAEMVVEAAPLPAKAAVAAADVRPPSLPPPPPAKLHTLWLGEWKYGTATDRVKADDTVRRLKEALDRANFRGAETMVVERAGEKRLAFHLGRLQDPAAADVRARLATLQKFKVGTQLPFAQASIVELPK